MSSNLQVQSASNQLYQPHHQHQKKNTRVTNINWQERAEQSQFQVKNLISGKLSNTEAGSLIDKYSARDYFQKSCGGMAKKTLI